MRRGNSDPGGCCPRLLTFLSASTMNLFVLCTAFVVALHVAGVSGQWMTHAFWLQGRLAPLAPYERFEALVLTERISCPS
jgi:hypothetical protein